MPNLGFWEILAILAVIVLLFGAKKLPDAARSLGRSMRIFKSEVKEMKNDDVERAEIEAQRVHSEIPTVQETMTQPVEKKLEN
ncbi:sec-independent protein translocase protein [Corynebacterium kutscheri]|uniref:Sec-independent protein translocase protein TatA n=1 Tax=Corynebacterium kutscheri TaxID=35755 RepID=A0A0F6TDF7_9CORY|nr:Sec-independent protein translocase subunit TatA [Corynebacterium kutscheri]AKE41209.1 twin arginine-targeting protein translocase, TatA/E family [Corynebacterium kutscheri]VEH08485.1 sec-independent protein translocase protein [Corynebacterium kutscheri]VEH09531.1 sec-independent protein translocase protein [Corynebacterium kutscheri]VEH79614.1 sec-independent protein translocase protein [Corynebacterium kutscheri]